MRSFRDVIDHFGFAKLAALFGVAQSHVRAMKTRNSIPAQYWGLIAEEAKKEGLDLTFEALRTMREQRFAHSEAAQ